MSRPLLKRRRKRKVLTCAVAKQGRPLGKTTKQVVRTMGRWLPLCAAHCVWRVVRSVLCAASAEQSVRWQRSEQAERRLPRVPPWTVTACRSALAADPLSRSLDQGGGARGEAAKTIGQGGQTAERTGANQTPANRPAAGAMRTTPTPSLKHRGMHDQTLRPPVQQAAHLARSRSGRAGRRTTRRAGLPPPWGGGPRTSPRGA